MKRKKTTTICIKAAAVVGNSQMFLNHLSPVVQRYAAEISDRLKAEAVFFFSDPGFLCGDYFLNKSTCRYHQAQYPLHVAAKYLFCVSTGLTLWMDFHSRVRFFFLL